jgi:hypothetical protein
MDALERWPGSFNDILGLEAPAHEAAVALLMEDTAGDALSMLRYSHVPTRRAMAAAFQAWPSPAVNAALVRLLSDEDTSVRLVAAQTIGVIGAEVLPLLAPLVNDPDVQYVLQLALRWIGGEAVPWLLDLVSRPDQQARELAIRALSEIGTPAAVFGLAERGVGVQPR